MSRCCPKHSKDLHLSYKHKSCKDSKIDFKPPNSENELTATSLIGYVYGASKLESNRCS